MEFIIPMLIIIFIFAGLVASALWFLYILFLSE